MATQVSLLSGAVASAGSLKLQSNGTTDAVTIDTSQNVGIGTSSPSVQLHLQSSAPVIRLTDTSASTDAEIYCNSAAGSLYLRADHTNVAASSLIGFQIDGSDKMTLDSSGNLGLGVTPSAWGSNYKVFEGQLGQTFYTNGSNFTSGLVSNAFNAGSYGTPSWKYSTTNAAARYELNGGSDGSHKWFNAASGTAGNAITFTQAMTLDASGNLGVGTTTTTYRVNFAQAGGGGTFYNVLWQAQGAGSPLAWNIDSASKYITSSYGAAINCESGNGAITFYNAPSGTAGTSATLTERARIDSSGNFLVGGTGLSVSNNGFQVTPAGRSICSMSSSTSAATTLEVYSTGAGAFRFYVDLGGTVHATSTTITGISDERLKENIRDLDTGLSTVMALKPRRYDWKEGKGLDKKNAAGFIAQEFEEVFPECVGTSLAGEDGIEYKNINYETLIPTLTKAIQEQQAIITQLQADVEALKGKA